MKCKLSEKCEFGNLCKDATRHDSLTVLGCSSFKTKKPLTNEEWLRSATTEELAIWIERIMFIVRYREEVENGAYMQTITKKDYIERWLKQPHQGE